MAKYEIASINGYAIQSAELGKVSATIIKLVDNIKTGYIKLGRELVNLRDSKLYELMSKENGGTFGFIEYCDEVLGIKKTAIYRAMNAYERVYLPLIELPDSASAKALLKLPDVSMSELATLGSAEGVKMFALECDDSGITFDSVTTREFARFLKEYTRAKRGSENDDESREVPPPDNTAEQRQVEAIKEAKAIAAEVEADAVNSYLADLASAENAERGENETTRYDMLVFTLVKGILTEYSAKSKQANKDWYKAAQALRDEYFNDEYFDMISTGEVEL